MSQYAFSRSAVGFSVDGPPPRLYESPASRADRSRRIKAYRKANPGVERGGREWPMLHEDGTIVSMMDMLHYQTARTRRMIDEVCGITAFSQGDPT